MSNARLILDFRDEDFRPTRRTVADGLARLEQELGESPDLERCHLHAPRRAVGAAWFASLWYRSPTGNDIVIAYPCSRGCTARTEAGARIDLSLEALDGARLGEKGNVLLSDGRSVHALEFDVMPHPKDFTDLEHAIVQLTIRFLNADHIGFRYIPEPGFWWIDYSRLRELCVQNVKELALYIDCHIGKLPRGDGEPPLGPVSLDKIQRTLSVAGIRKARGRKPKIAA